jgi:hypothetical protein
MSESKADEQYMANSDIASRMRMTDEDWKAEAIRNMDFEDELDAYEFAQTVFLVYSNHPNDIPELGCQIKGLLDNAADNAGKRLKEDFLEEVNNG